MRYVTRFLDILGSFGLAITIFLLLGVLTFFGTLEQGHASLHEVRTKYFDSVVFFPDQAPFLPLPGAALLLGVLFVNLVVGGVIRMKRTNSRIGIFIIHAGILWLLLSGLVEFYGSNKGYLTLFEGDRSAVYHSFHDWDITIAEQLPDGRERAFVIPHAQLPKPGEKATFTADGLPFTVGLRGFLTNCRPRPASGDGGIDGFVLERLANHPTEAENNIAGVTVRLSEPGGVYREALLWGVPRAVPYVTRLSGRRWSVNLAKRRWDLPFDITLKNFTRKLHPGTGLPSVYSSDVTRVQDNVAQDIHISMNDPMRHEGFTFYQSGWGERGGRLYSTFSVVENPADRGPLYACIVIAIGLLWQFLRKLRLHIRAEVGRRS